MKTHTPEILKRAAIVFAAVLAVLSIGACAHKTEEVTTTTSSTHSHAPGTPPHTH